MSIKNAVMVGTDVSQADYQTNSIEHRGKPIYVLRSHDMIQILTNAQRWVKGYQSPESKSQKIGSLIDCIILTPKQFFKRYSILPADAPRRPSDRQRNAKKPSPATLEAIAWWDDFKRNNPGELIDQEDNGTAHAAAKRLLEDGLIKDLIESSAHSVMLTADWEDPSGVTVSLKCLIDILPSHNHPIFGDAIYDLKTTKNASKWHFKTDAQRYRYDVQAGFYLDMWNAVSQENRNQFGHVILENFFPFEYRTPPPPMTERFLNFGRASYQKALAIYCHGIQTGKWPSYDVQGKWDVTDCDDWFVNPENLYDPMPVEPDPEEDEPEPAEELDVQP